LVFKGKRRVFKKDGVQAVLKNAVYVADRFLPKTFVQTYLHVPPDVFTIYAGMYQQSRRNRGDTFGRVAHFAL
jgi:hypothetical protein